ncbi:hypothetical protein JTE90_018514 [Oedothorax gibbosus]|uniref:Uncharacterized protein n=1 Tax=Oedothorax gibbosus TaxID=931172 RepID=A0AAV6UN29_9ARAC|nr:hypothetical protein JTE90_018514 [Oedothorax gibbosus]
MSFYPLILSLLLTSVLVNVVQLRPRTPIGYFPSQPHPWAMDPRNYGEEMQWGPFVYPDDESRYNNYIQSYRKNLGTYADQQLTKDKLGAKFPVYTSIQDGFVPTDLAALDSVYWWKKRFPGERSSFIEEVPLYSDNDESNMIDTFDTTGSVNKRDYTAAQLINMLKALAKARRQRQVRITGKGIRFGISK